MNDATFAAVEASAGMFNLVVPLINTNINPGNADYKEFYINDRNMIVFSSQLGAIGKIKIQEDTVETDNSLMPWT